MTGSPQPEIPTPTDVMLQRTRHRAGELRRRRRLVLAGLAAAVVASAIAVPLALSDHSSTHVVNVVGGTSSPPTAGRSSPAGPSGTTTVNPALGTPTPTPTPAPSVAPTTLPARTAPSHPAPACRTTALQAGLTSGNGAAAGSVGYELTLRNIGGTTCTLFGYPGVSYVRGPAGTIVGAPARRDQISPLATVTLAPHHAAEATLIEIDSLNYPPTTCRLATVAGLRIYPPNQTASLVVAQATRACGNAADPVLEIGPVEGAP